MKDATIAKLFANAAGRCSMCRADLFIEQVKIGEMAHIIGKKKAAARGKVEFQGDLNTYENLILLCPNDHAVVDGNEFAYPVARLHAIKAGHELWVRTSLQNYSKRYVDVAGLQVLMRFLPFTQLRGLVEFLPGRFDMKILEAASALEAFPIDNPQCHPFNDPELELYYSRFADRLFALVQAIEGPSFGKSGYLYLENKIGVMVLNRELTFEERSTLMKSVNEAAGQFLPEYMQLMDFLRSNYHEVDLTAYC